MTDVGGGTFPGAHAAYLSWTDTSGQSNRLTFDVVQAENWDEGATVTEHPVEVGADVGDHVRVTLVKCELKIRSSNEPIDSNAFDDAITAPAPLNPAGLTSTWVPGPGVVIVPNWVNPIELRALAGSLIGLAGSAAGLGGAGGVVGGLVSGALIPAFEVDLPVSTTAGLTPPGPAPPPSPQTQQWPAGTDYVEATHALLVQLKNTAQLIDVFGSKQVQFSMVIEKLIFDRSGETGTGEDITIGLKEIRVVSTQTVAAPIPNLSAGGGKPPVPKGAQDPQDAATVKQALDVKLWNGIASLVGGPFG